MTYLRSYIYKKKSCWKVYLAVIVKEALSKVTVSWISGLGVNQESAGPGFDSESTEAPPGEGSKCPCGTAVPASQFDIDTIVSPLLRDLE